MNRKGNYLDWFIIIAVLLLVGLTLMATFIVVDKVDDVNVFTEEPTANSALGSTKTALLGFDTLVLFMIIGLSLFVLISSALVYNHPAFFIIGVILLFIAIILAGIVSNAWWDFSNSNSLLETSSSFPKLNFLFDRLPIYILFMGMAATVTMYVSYRRT